MGMRECCKAWCGSAAKGATGETYEIRTVADFLRVPEARRRICLREFDAWMALQESVPALLYAAGLPKGSLRMREPDVFRWRDDGKATMSVEIAGLDDQPSDPSVRSDLRERE